MSADEIKKTLENPALSPTYRQVLERRLQELTDSGRPTEVAKPAGKTQPYRGVKAMTTAEIVQYYSTGQFYRLDQPISGLEALKSVYRFHRDIDGVDLAHVAEAIGIMERN